MQLASLVQDEGHVADVPLHTYGVHAGEPACPAPSTVQRPTLPGGEQLSHAPLQAALQHTPSTQNPDWHSAPVVHVAPLAAQPGIGGKLHWPVAGLQTSLVQAFPSLHFAAPPQAPAWH